MIVTGAGGGLGAAHAKVFASEGASVIVNDINQAAAQKVVDEIIAAGGKSHRAVGIAVQRVNGALEIAQRRAERVQAAAFSIQLRLLFLQVCRLSGNVGIGDFLRNGSWVDH